MMIRLDISARSVVITCDACPYWSAIQLERADAEQSGARHEALVHPDSYDFRQRIAAANHRRRARHAGSEHALTMSMDVLIVD